MTEPKYKVGQCVKAHCPNKRNSKYIVGVISDIDESTGAKTGIIYEICNEWYFENDIVGVLPIEKTPAYYWEQMHNIEMEMQDEIYNLVLKFGKVKHLLNARKGSGDTLYTLNLVSSKTPHGVLIRDRGNEPVYLVKAEISTCETWGRGYLRFYDNDDVRYAMELDCYNQAFNVYSSIFRMLERRILINVK